MGLPAASSTVFVLEGRWGNATLGRNADRSMVYYSIGNFVSAQPEKSCVKGGMAHFTIAPVPDGVKVTEYGLSPLAIQWQKGGGYAPVFGKE